MFLFISLLYHKLCSRKLLCNFISNKYVCETTPLIVSWNFIVLKPLNGICKPKFRAISSHLDVQGFPWKECFVHIVKLGGLQYHYRSISPISIPQGSCSHGISVAFQTENSIYWLFGRFLRILILGLKVWFAQSNWKFGWGWVLLVPVGFHPSVTWCIV